MRIPNPTDQIRYAVPMTESILVIHVLNKNSVGGAESLVASLVKQQQIGKEGLAHKSLFIATNHVSVQLLGLKIIRFLPILMASVKLGIFAIRSNRSRRKTAIIFHLAECHVVAKICGPVISNLPHVKIFIYLHQSRELFPEKIRWVTDSLIRKYETICYSDCATKTWFTNSTSDISKRTTIHNPVGIKSSRNRYTKSLTLNLLFIGRFTPWKRPDMAIAIANRLAALTPVKLQIVGFKKSDFVEHYGEFNDLNSPLSINFLGSIRDVVPLIQDSDLLLNLAESNLSGESIGIAALESLSLGVPVLIQDSKMSDFQQMPGIYSLNYFEKVFEKISKDSQPALYFRNSFNISPEERVFWEEKTSLATYNNQLSLLLANFLEETRKP